MVGNGVFFAVAITLIVAFSSAIGLLSVSILPVLVLGAAALTAVEAGFSRGFDNFTVPLSGAVLAWLLINYY